MLHSLAVSSLSQPTTSSPPKPRNIAVISALQTAVIGVFRHSRTLTFEWMADSLSAAPGIEELCCTVDANLSPSLFVAQQHRPIEDIVEPGGDGGRARGKSKADVALVLLSSVINCMIPIQVSPELAVRTWRRLFSLLSVFCFLSLSVPVRCTRGGVSMSDSRSPPTLHTSN